jgi:hypothetical protein
MVRHLDGGEDAISNADGEDDCKLPFDDFAIV